MKNSLFILILPFYFIFACQAQNISIEPHLDSSKPDCKDLIVADETIDGKVQVLKTKPLTIVKRGNYSYGIEFINDQRGIVAKVYSNSGVQLKKGDQLIFMDESKNRGAYSFIETGKNVLDGEMSIHSNILKIDRIALDWFSNRAITTLYIKGNVKNEMRKFTISESSAAELKQLANCFNLILTKSEY